MTFDGRQFLICAGQTFPAPCIMAKRKKTGIQCLAKFPADAQEKFIVNLISDSGDASTVARRLTQKYDSAEEMLSRSFTWHNTPEGHDYWMHICAGL